MALRTTPGAPAGAFSGGTGFTTQLPVMNSASAYVEQVGQNMMAQVNKMMGQLAALGPNQWNGPARDAYFTAQNRWNASHQDLTNKLNSIAADLNTTGKHYNTMDTTNQQNFTRTGRALP